MHGTRAIATSASLNNGAPFGVNGDR